MGKIKKKIVFIGDSITDVKFNIKSDLVIHGKSSYPLQVIKKLGKSEYKPYYRGIASNRSYHVYDRFSKDCLDIEPDVVVLFIGVNDAWSIYKAEDYPKRSRVHTPNRPFEPHFDELIRRLKTELSQEEKVIVMSPFLISTIQEKMPFKDFLVYYRDYIKNKTLEAGFRYIDLQSIFDKAEKNNKPSALSVDGVHPTSLGHKYIAEAVLEEILN